MSVDDHRDYVPYYPGGRGDVEQSLARYAELGGTAITPIEGLGEGISYVEVQDPAGAVLALSSPTPNEP